MQLVCCDMQCFSCPQPLGRLSLHLFFWAIMIHALTGVLERKVPDRCNRINSMGICNRLITNVECLCDLCTNQSLLPLFVFKMISSQFRFTVLLSFTCVCYWIRSRPVQQTVCIISSSSACPDPSQHMLSSEHMESQQHREGCVVSHLCLFLTF